MSALWRVMQLIEANRHLAERLETAALTADAATAPVLARAADQRRRLADEIYDRYRCDGAVWADEDFDPERIIAELIQRVAA